MIKFTLLTMALVSASFFAQAQITKGSVLLGGGLSFGSNKSESGLSESKSRSFSFSPAVGIAVKDNAVVGVRLSYNRSKAEQPDPSYQQENTGYNAGVFYRRYLGLSKAFYLFGEGAAYYGANKSETRNGTNNSKNTQRGKTVGVSLYPGVAYVVSRRFHLEAGLNNLLNLQYTSNKIENTVPGATFKSTSSGFDFSTNLSTAAPLTVGFRVVLGK